MDATSSQVFTPENYTELFAAWSRFPEAQLFAGGTAFLCGQGSRLLNLPPHIISLQKMNELRRITRTERYLEIGAGVSLSEILLLGKIVPEALLLSLKNIATAQIRNLATLGGNICCRKRPMDAVAALVALDARYELRDFSTSRWVAASKYSSFADSEKPRELVCRIRIPLEHWDFTLYRKFGAVHVPVENGGAITFIASAQKNILSDLRLVFAGPTLMRDRDIETSLVGKLLPLGRKESGLFMDRWREKLDHESLNNKLLRDQVLNFIESVLVELSE